MRIARRWLVAAAVFAGLARPTLAAAQLPPWPCPPTITTNLGPHSWAKQGYGNLSLRFIAPLKMTMIPFGNFGFYIPARIEVTGPGSRPWVASGVVETTCWLVNPYIVARVIDFIGDAKTVGEEEPEEPDYETDCEGRAYALVPGSAPSLSRIQAPGEASLYGDDDAEECEEEEWDGGGGGGGDPPEDGPAYLCLDIDWYYGEVYLFSTTECFRIEWVEE